MFQFWAAVCNEREEGGAANAHGRRTRTKGMVIDEAHGRRVRRTDEERGPTKSIADGYRRKMRTAAMDVVRAAAGVSDSGEKVSVSLTASAGTDDESCAGGWGTMIDIGGAMSIIGVDCIMLFSRIEEQCTSSSVESK